MLLPHLHLPHTRTVPQFHRQARPFKPPNSRPRRYRNHRRRSFHLLQSMASHLVLQLMSTHSQLRRRAPSRIPAHTRTRVIIPIPTLRPHSCQTLGHPVRTFPGRRNAPVVIHPVRALTQMLPSFLFQRRKTVRTSARVSTALRLRDGTGRLPSSTRPQQSPRRTSITPPS